MQFFFCGLDGVIAVPDGADLSDWYNRVSPGQTLSLAANGHYTLPALATGFSTLPSGTASEHITVQGNGATITGGLIGIAPTNKSYIDFINVHLRDQTQVCAQVNNSDHITFTDCSFASHADASFIDVCKVRNCNNVTFTRCTITETLGTVTCDGFEFWDCNDCTCTDCSASGLHNGASAIDNGHGFEVYGENAGETCTNIQFVRCHATDCRAGFTVESPNANAPHTVFLTDCTSSDMEFFDYYAEAPGTMDITGFDGGTTGGDGTINHD